MKLIYTDEELPQRSEEWLEIRKKSIGGSEIASVIGQNPYMSARKLWEIRTGKREPTKENEAMRRGARMEPLALKEISTDLIKNGFEGANLEQFFVIHPDYDFIAVSFDGVDLKNAIIVELKCPMKAANFKIVAEGNVPTYYYPQVQYQLMVSYKTWGIDTAYFYSYYPDGVYISDFTIFKDILHTLARVEVIYDPHYCDEIVKIAKKFHDYVQYDYWDDAEYKELVENFNDNTQNTDSY